MTFSSVLSLHHARDVLNMISYSSFYLVFIAVPLLFHFSEVLQCARKVSQRGFTIFGLQFFGECWSGENSVKTYDRDGPYDRCLMVVNNMEYKQCNDSSVNLCIGVENSNYVYKIIQAGT